MEAPAYPDPQKLPYPTEEYTPGAPQGYQPPPQPPPSAPLGYQPPPQPISGYQPAPADFKGDPQIAAPPPGYYPPPPQPQQQQATTVVITQPHANVTHIPHHSVGDNYLTLSVVLTVICILCCTWYGLCCTVPAIIFATMAREAEGRGNYRSARSNANLALGCNIAGVVWWVLATIIIIVSISVAAATGNLAYNNCYYGYSYYYGYYYYDCYYYK